MRRGIDISNHQTGLDYTSLGRQIDFVIIQSSWGTGTRNPMFLTHYNGFKALRKQIDLYHFMYAVNDSEALQNARNAIKRAEEVGFPKERYIFCDLEYDTVDNARERGVILGPEEIDRFTRIFCDEIIRAGYKTGIYTNGDYYEHYYAPETLKKYPIWYCGLDGGASPKHACMIWQYSWTGYDWDYWMEDEAPAAVSITEKATQWMINLANDDSHGYDQVYRWGERGDYDCSSAVITAYRQAGVPLSCTYTGNMRDDMLRHGFRDVTGSCDKSTGAGLVRGDVLLNETHHTAIYIGNGQEVEASINERGTATGGQPGDQTGREILIRSYRNYPWDCVLRFYDAEPAPDPAEWHPTGTATCTADDVNVRATPGGAIMSQLGKGNRFETDGQMSAGWIHMKRTDLNQIGWIWGEYVKPDGPAEKKSVEELARDVIAGKYGNGEERKRKLEAEGYDYTKVQAEVNRILK